MREKYGERDQNKDSRYHIASHFRVREKIKEISLRFELCEIRDKFRGTRNEGRADIITAHSKLREKIKEISSRFELSGIREKYGNRSQK